MSTTTTSLSSGHTTGDHPAPSVADVLKKARALIEKRQSWCTGSFYKGKRCCAEGALLRALGAEADSVFAPNGTYDLHVAACQSLVEAVGGQFLWTFNDTSTHAEVLAAFDRAIAATEIARVTAQEPATTTAGA